MTAVSHSALPNLPVPVQGVVARKAGEDEEAVVYEVIGGYLLLLRRTDCDYEIGIKFITKLKDALELADFLTTQRWKLTDWETAQWYGEYAALLCTPPWLPEKASRPYLAYTYARRAANYALRLRPWLRGEPKRPDTALPGELPCDACGHELCYHVAVRLPCLCECTCRSFRRPVMN
jgi:hypothetical protein